MDAESNGAEGLLSPVPEFVPEFVPDPNPDDETSDKRMPDFDEQDYSSHRNVYVAVHVPYSVPHRRHHHHKKRHRKKIHIKSESASGRSTPLVEEVDQYVPPRTPVDPCDRVKFILGDTEEGHHIFTELEELSYSEHGQNLEWKETARWVKFEEDVEEGGDKWSKPHVATLSLHSLFDLRSCMLKGTVLLDLVGGNLEEISDNVVDELVASKQLEEENRQKVREALLHRHRHQCTKKSDSDKKLFPNIRSTLSGQSKKSDDHNNSHNGFLNWIRQGSNTDVASGNTPTSSKRKDSSFSDTNVTSTTDNNEDTPHMKFDHHFMKKLPPGSEASNVLVGEVDFLQQSIIAFVRLSEAQMLGITEVPLPTRFLFILLGPRGNHGRYHEVGRAIATLMADEVFHSVAYKARNREDLLAGVDEFLDKVTVLPPGEWDPQIRLEPPPQVPSQNERKVGAKEHSNEKEKTRPPVEFSKIPFKGLVDDIKRRYSKYLLDFRDAFWDTSRNKCSILAFLTTIASIIFIYFANIAPAITFGQVLSEKTNGAMGPVLMIISVSIGNFVYALTAGQPLVVLGGTGPTLIFEDILFQFCEEQGLPYLQFRFWIGLWVAFFIILLVAFNASVIVRLFTRFTEEIFSALISFIFIYEAFEKIWKIHLVNPYSGYFWYPFWKRDCQCYEFDTPDNFFKYMTNESSALLTSNATSLGYYWEYYTDNDFIQSCDNISQLRTWVGPECPWIFKHNVLFFSIILFFGTFAVAFYLKKFKNSPFFPTWVRRIISDFGVLISVVIWVLVNFFVHVEGVANLDVPDILSGSSLFSNDSNGRTSLLINPVENLPAWVPFASIIPALLATILLFMDQQITALIVNRKDNKLQKGPGYHLDMLIVAVLIGVFSVLGLPWVVGATVRSIAHVQSLFLYSPCTAPGERPKFLGVKEQRVTLLCMSILLGISILAHQVLQLIPLPVLYGLFLYMGVTSLYGVQFVERIGIMFMPDKYKPDEEYVRHIPNRRLHLYTIVQIFMLLVLCVFKVVNEISIIFPIMVLLLVAGRWLVGWFFPERDLEILDDPIPKSLYCGRPCSPSKMKKKRYRSNKTSGDVEKGVEKGVEEVDSSHNGGINISHEVNRCDLWQHMVHTLDKEPERCRKNLSERFEQEMVKIGDESARQLNSVDANNATLTQYKSTEI